MTCGSTSRRIPPTLAIRASLINILRLLRPSSINRRTSVVGSLTKSSWNYITSHMTRSTRIPPLILCSHMPINSIQRWVASIRQTVLTLWVLIVLTWCWRRAVLSFKRVHCSKIQTGRKRDKACLALSMHTHISRNITRSPIRWIMYAFRMVPRTHPKAFSKIVLTRATPFRAIR